MNCYICEQHIEGPVLWLCDEGEQVQCRCTGCYPGSPAWAAKFPDTLASQLYLQGVKK